MSARLPRHVRDAHHRRGRQGSARGGRSGASLHERFSVREGQPVCRTDVPSRPVALPDASRRRERTRPVRAHHVGRGARRDRGTIERDPRLGARTSSDPAVLIRRHDGLGAGELHRPPILSYARRVEARSYDLLDARDRRDAHDRRREHRRGRRRHSGQ